MEFEPLKNETPKMRQFREDMENAGIEVRIYSGRGMFGKETYGVYCGGRREGALTEQEVYQATKVKLAADSMGFGTILYVG